MSMRGVIRPAVIAVVLFVVAGCGTVASTGDGPPASDGAPISPLPSDGAPISPLPNDGAPISPLPSDGAPISPLPNDGAPISPLPNDELLGQGTVLQKGEEQPQFCLGAVAESYPPQCTGPALHGWNWDSAGHAETASNVTWGTYAVHGTWDGTAFTVTREPIPLSLYDAMPMEEPRLDEDKAGAGNEAQLLRIQQDLHESGNPDVLTSWPANGYLFVTVSYDDGELQKFFDRQHGPNLIAVQSALQPVK